MRDVEGTVGYHEGKDGQPFAVVDFGRNWSLMASHEILEMLGASPVHNTPVIRCWSKIQSPFIYLQKRYAPAHLPTLPG